MESNPAVKNSGKFVAWLKRLVSGYSIVIITIAMVILATILGGTTFLQLQNILNVIRSNVVLGIIAFGVAFVIITGNIDLSVGSQLVMSGVVLFWVMNGLAASGMAEWLIIVISILACIATSCAISLLTSVIVTKGRVPAFITTLGMNYILRSVATFALDARGLSGELKSYEIISNATWFDNVFPVMILYFAAMFVVYWYISKYTVMGRHFYAVGSNEKAARLSGINTDRVKMLAWLMLGIAIGIATMIETSRMNAINSTSSGQSYDLNTIAMTVVGGVAMEGGKGKMVNVLFGIFVLGIINNILTIIGMNVYLVSAVKGAIIILSVLLQRKDKES